MNRIKEHHILTIAIAALMGALILNAWLADAATIDIPRYTVNIGRVEPNTFGVAIPDEDGPYVMYDNLQPIIDAAVAEAITNCTGTGATTDWATDPPTQNESTLLCEIRTGVYGFRDYIDGQWKVGANAGPAPLAWAKINARTTE